MRVCNFCGKGESEVKRIIAAKDADICDECVLVCMEILIKNQREYKELEFNTNQSIKEDRREE